MNRHDRLTRRIRALLVLFIAGLVTSGLTALPLVHELNALGKLLGIDPSLPPTYYAGLRYWIALVGQGLRATAAAYPFMAYGTDWLAFGHFAIAIAFLGPLRNPVRNVWVLEFGMIACFAVIPMALIAGAVRGIPMYWRLIDCSFGVFGFIPLWLCHGYTKELERLEGAATG